MRWLKAIFSINPASLTLATIILIIGLCVSGSTILDTVERKTYDLRFLSRGPLPPAPAVVLGLIDEKSLATEGHWPWPRSRIAALIDRLAGDGARVIGFDIGFLEPDPEPQNDLALAEAMRQSPAAVVLGYFFHMRQTDLNYRPEPQDIAQQLQRIAPSKYPFIIYKDPGLANSVFWRAYAPQSNLAMLTEAASASGYFTLRLDQDGVVRWMPLMIQSGEEVFPPLSVLCAWYYLGKPQLTIDVGSYGVEGVQMGERFIPTDEHGQLLINYLGAPPTFAQFSLSDILHGRFRRGTFRDKIVLVGATATGLYDLRSTPVSPAHPGIEIHATVIDNILTQRFLTRPRWSKIYDLLAIVLLASLIGIALPHLGVLKSLGFCLGLWLVTITLASWLFVRAGVWLTIVYPLLALTSNYLGLAFHHMAQRLRQAFRNLQASERKYRSLFEDSNDAIFVTTLSGALVDMNPAGRRLFGLSPKAVPTMQVDDLYVNAADQQRFNQAIEQHGAVTDFEVQLQKQDGSPFEALMSATSRYDPLGTIIGYQGIIRDITLAKQHERLRTENLRLGTELDIVRRLQRMILPTPDELQAIPQLDIAGYMAPADEVGGDYYDVLQHNGHIKIGIGDVTGHGLESGVLMLMTQMGVRTLLTRGDTNPVHFLDVLNRTLYHNLQRMAIDKSLSLALIDYTPHPCGGGRIRLSGQHEELIVMRQGGIVERVDTIDLGFPVGLEDTIADFVGEHCEDLAAGDGVVLYTDGITEAENPAREHYGLERLCALLAQHWHLAAASIIEAVIQDLQHYIGEQTVYDDITLVVIKQQ